MAKYLSRLLLNLWMKSSWYYHPIETPLAEHLQSAICFLGFHKEEFNVFDFLCLQFPWKLYKILYDSVRKQGESIMLYSLLVFFSVYFLYSQKKILQKRV